MDGEEMTKRIKQQLDRLEKLMVPREVPKPRITIHYIDPETREVVGVVRYPLEKDEAQP
jgi:hypothetical protein